MGTSLDAKYEEFWRQSIKQLNEVVKATGMPIAPDEKGQYSLWYDVRELRIRFSISVERIKRFFEGLREGKIYATRCRRCGRYYFLPQADCPYCRVSDMDWVEVGGEGELLTYTVINTKPLTFSHYPDYVVAIARMKEGFNVLAWLRIDDPRKIRVSMRVRLQITRREPEGYLTYEFVPIE
ncbi:MAG: 3-hydroxybutyryl-CoA epimerase [Vulcanisaeta sp. MG_3]|jgi:Predicted nucleic-acid-binding protein containing a Zn-ribbon|nr:MAG: 3-hydroxybutyryl-CoA epimerase [Vulcanisaeta sp. MG_3]